MVRSKLRWHTPRKLLTSDPTLAAEQADEVLKVAPGNPVATVILGASHRARGNAPAALAILDPLARAYPDWVTPHYELGLALGLAGRSGDAVAALRRAVALKPEMGDAWRALGDHLNALGDVQGADAAYAQHIKAATRDPRLLEPAAALCDGRIAVAETLLRAHLKRFPTDVVAIRMLAEVAARLGRFADSEALLARCLELAPGFNAARHNYAVVLHRQDRFAEALREVEQLLAADPTDTGGRNLKAALLGKLGRGDSSRPRSTGRCSASTREPEPLAELRARAQDGRPAVGVHRGLPQEHRAGAGIRRGLLEPRQPQDLPLYAAGRRGHAARSSRRADLTIDDRFHFHFALGKALEDMRGLRSVPSSIMPRATGCAARSSSTTPTK